MLCHFCQNLTFLPAGELNLPGVDLSEVFPYEDNPLAALISVHQPSLEALEISASHGCRLCAFFWFELFGFRYRIRDPLFTVIMIKKSHQTSST
jgi:hypothetical protein